MAYINRPDELARLMQEHPDLPVIPVVSKDAVIFGMRNGDAFFAPTIGETKVQKYILADDYSEIHFEEEYEYPEGIKWTGTAITVLMAECE